MNMHAENHYVLKNVRVIDVEDEATFTGSIEIESGMIRNIFLEDSILPTALKTINGGGKYIIPGLIDMHCHIKEGFAIQFVASGVTTVRNTAGNVIQLKKLIEASNDEPTPGIYSADRMIDGPPGLWGATGIANFVTDDPIEAKKEVIRQKKAGAKFIKIYGLITKEVMQAVVAEADQQSLEVSCDLMHAS